jgi:hypothetical protein
MHTHVRNEVYDPSANQPLFLNSHAISQTTAFLRNELSGGDDEHEDDTEYDDILG